MDAAEPVNVRVKYANGAYVTQTVRGCRASSTNAPRYAIQNLASKLFPQHACAVRELPAKGQKPGCSMWRIEPQSDA